MITLILCICLIFVSDVYASNWVLLIDEKQGSTYYDPSSIKSNGSVVTVATLQKHTYAQKGIHYSGNYTQIDCYRKQYNFIATYDYDSNMNIVSSLNNYDGIPPRKIPGKSRVDILMRKVCN